MRIEKIWLLFARYGNVIKKIPRLVVGVFLWGHEILSALIISPQLKNRKHFVGHHD